MKERARKQIPDEKIRPVLFRLSYQAFIEWRRKEMSEERKRQALIQLRPPADEEEALVEAVFEEALAVGSSLSPQQKEILVLRVRCAMSVDDVCVALSISNSTYHRSMRRAEEKLKELFAQVRSSSDLHRRSRFGGTT